MIGLRRCEIFIYDRILLSHKYIYIYIYIERERERERMEPENTMLNDINQRKTNTT